MPFASYVFDLRSSTRAKDANGFLHIKLNNITRGQVSPYLGREVSAKDDLGWDDERVYSLLRDPEELRKATPSYNGLPVLFGHHECDASTLPKDQIIGTTGTEAAFNGDFMQNSITIWDASAVKAIEDEEIVELSCGYAYTLDPSKGEFNGASYDGVMRDIKPNHVALVEKGRAGAEVRIGDSAIDADKPGHAYHGNQFTGGAGAGGIKKKAKRTTTVAIKDIAKRAGVSPKTGVSEYGKVTFADPKNKKYPLDTRAHVRSALSYWGMAKNRSKYSKSDQSVIGGRIKAAAKRLGIGQTTGDSAGKMKETTMANSAKKALSPLAHRVAGAVHAHLRSKLAADAAIDGAELLALVKNASDAKFAKQINGIVGAVKDQYGLSNVDELRGLLLEIADDELEDPEAGDEDEEAEGEDEDADDPESGKKAKPFEGKETPEEEKAEMQAMAKKAGDAAVEQVRAEFKALRQAERDVQPLVGEVNGLDTAEAVYKYALDHAGIDTKDVHPSALPHMVKMLRDQPASRAADTSVAVDAAGTLERFPNLKNLKRTL